MRKLVAFTTVLTLAAAPAFAAYSGGPPDSTDSARSLGRIAADLPVSLRGVNAAPSGYLHIAEDALHRGQTRAARGALAMARMRLLGHSMPGVRSGRPDRTPAVEEIDVALRDLSRNDIGGAEQATRRALTDRQMAWDRSRGWTTPAQMAEAAAES